jgi:antitoxin component YwqK of YwqJK toxin-antitoxin module
MAIAISGYHQVVTTYDQRGNILTEAHYDLDGNPVIGEDKEYAMVVYQYDENGKVMKTSYLDTEGQPINISKGFASIMTVRDGKGNVLLEEYQDDTYRPVMLKAGYAAIARSYDENNKVIRQTYLDETGRSVLIKGSKYAMVEYAYDEKGDVTEKRSYYQGILEGVTRYEYDGEELIRVYHEDPQGEHVFDCRVENGIIIEKSFSQSAGGYAYFYEYDANGNLVKETGLVEGETVPIQSHAYKAVEVEPERVPFLLAQQKYLLDIT